MAQRDDSASPSSLPVAQASTRSHLVIRRQLRQFAYRLKGWLLLDGLARFLWFIPLVLVSSLAVDYAIDRWLEWPRSPRQVVSLAWGLTTGALFLTLVGRRFFRRIDEQALADLVESHHPEFHGQLISAVEPATIPSETSTTLRDEAARLAADRLTPNLLRPLINPARPLRRLGLALLGLVFVGLAAWTFPSTARAWYQRILTLADVSYPRIVQLGFVGREGTVSKTARGRPAEILVAIDPLSPEPSEVRLDIGLKDGSRRRTVLFTKVSDRLYRAALRSVDADLVIRAYAGDGRTPPHHLRAVDPPLVQKIDVEITPPSYARQGPFVTPFAGTPISVLVGSTVTLRGTTSKSMHAIRITLGPKPLAVTQPSPSSFAATWQAETAETAGIQGTDTDGIDFAEPFSVIFESQTDQSPRVDVSSSLSAAITPQARIPLRVRAEDDIGLGRISLFAQSGERLLLERGPIDGEPPWGKKVDQVQMVDIRPWGLKPGSRLRLFAEAADENDRTGPGRANSEPLEREVISEQEWLSRLATREIQLRQRFEQVLTELRDARTGMEQASQNSTDPQNGTTTRLAIDRARSTIRKDLVESQAIGLAYSDILNDLEFNRISHVPLVERIREGIVQPIEQWVTGPLPALLAEVETLPDASASSPAEPTPLITVQNRAAEVIQQGERILAAMQKLESFQEALTLLQSIMDDQRLLREATEKTEQQKGIDFLKEDGE